MKAVVLGAGVGSRLDPLTAKLPKPLVPIINVPVMQHIIRLLQKHGINEIVSNLHYMADEIEEYFAQANIDGVNLQFVREDNLTGDAGGVRACRSLLANETFLVIMGDLLTDANLNTVIAEHKQKKAIASIGVIPVDDVTKFGVVLRDSSGFIQGFQEKPSAQEALSNEISTGIYVLEPEVFDYIPKTGSYGFGRELFPLLVQKKLPVLGIKLNSYWSDIGSFEAYWRSNLDALEEKVKLSEGFSASDNNGSYIDKSCNIKGKSLIGKGSRLEKDVRLKGSTIIGENSIIGAGSRLENCVIVHDSSVPANSNLQNCIWSNDRIIFSVEN